MKILNNINLYDLLLSKKNFIALCGISTCATFAHATNLCTHSGQSTSIGLSDYTYEERELMTLQARKKSITYSKIHSFNEDIKCVQNGWFLGGQLHLTNGKADYHSPISGTLNQTPNWYIESKILIGKDHVKYTYVLSPHIGLGLRYLHNDLRTNDFRQGYRRDNLISYIPIGLTHKSEILNQYILSTTFEYSHFLKGNQKSSLSDQNPTAKNVSLSQSKGHGFKFEAMLRKDNWAFGPSVNYWKVNQSNTIIESGIYEPKNSTTEIGLKLTRFF
jgi:hypothetical protein